ncbi:MAG: hypothetical protein DMF60_13395 [Acidobacteria bacterium]|nr:MAG: hypothetical protein DMF60_13395 [Acidobacteriota bacterium]
MNNDEMSTTPTIETLLSRLNEWGERFTNELKDLKAGQQELGTGLGEVRTGLGEVRTGLSDLRNGQEELRKGQEELRNDLNAGLRRVERKIEILNDNILTVNADIRDLEVRLEKLEAESLTKN